jgi:hypothetical protein
MELLQAIISSILSAIVTVALDKYIDYRTQRRSKGPGGLPLPPPRPPRPRPTVFTRIGRWVLSISIFSLLSLSSITIITGLRPNVWFGKVVAGVEESFASPTPLSGDMLTPQPTSTPQGPAVYDADLNSGQILNENDFVTAYHNMSDKLIMQADGNFVIYANNGKAMWSNDRDDSGGLGATYAVKMQSDGNLVEYCYGTATCDDSLGNAVWDTGTEGHPGATLFFDSSPLDFAIFDGSAILKMSCGGVSLC